MRQPAFLAAALLLSWPAAADMYQDGSNAKNLTFTAHDSDMRGFVPPSFGGNWLAGQFLTSTDTVGHPFNTQMTTNIHRTAVGSGAFGPASSDMALMVTAGKTNPLTSLIEGELAGMWIVTHQGRKGDTGALITSSAKVKSGTADDTGAITSMEIAAYWTDAAGNNLWELHTLPSFGVGLGPLDVSGGGGYGILLGNNGPSAAGAANMIVPYSGVMVQNADAASQCPTHCSLWKHVVTAATLGNSDPASIYFQVSGGPTASGDIRMGSGWADLFGTPAQSGGHPVTMKNTGGAWQLYNESGTLTKTIQTSLSGGGVLDKLEGPSPQAMWRDTATTVTAGGLQRLAFSAGMGIWQINTAAAGNFSTNLTPIVVYPSGGVGVGAVSGGDPGLGNMNSSWYKVGGIAGVTCGAAPTAAFRVTGGIVTAC